MTKTKKIIRIDAPPEKIFNFLREPTNLLNIWPSLVDIRDINPLPNGGHFYRWIYKMGGIQFGGVNEDIEVLPNRRITASITGGIRCKITWTLEPEKDSTLVTFEADYQIPLALVGKLAEAVIVRMNERETESIVFNLMYMTQDMEDVEGELVQ